ncbi:MAG: HAMP domain-containing sensor histidine kinase [Dehalococcoidia bacterium]
MIEHAARLTTMRLTMIRTSPASRRALRLGAALLIGMLAAAIIDVGWHAILEAPGARIVLAAVAMTAAVSAGFVLGRLRLKELDVSASVEASSIAHDLRSPLLAVRAYLELMEEGAFGPLTNDGREAAGRAAHAMTRAQAMLDGWLLSYATQQASAPLSGSRGTTGLDTGIGLDGGGAETVADLTLIANDVRDALSMELADAGATLEIGQLPRVRADGQAMYRVLLNLVQNALRHRDGTAHLEITISATRRGELWEIEVGDNGPGISASLRVTAFEPGMRGPAAASTPGFGLGLATVRRLVQQNGGRVWIDDSTAGGASIRMTLQAASTSS